MKRYEGLFILNNTGKEEAIKETIDRISAEIATAGGKVETVQKMEKRPFVRVADKKFTSGFFVNIIFESAPAALSALHRRFVSSDDIFRVLFTIAPAPQPAAA